MHKFLCVNNEKNKKVILVTSSVKGEGKSFIAANMGIAFSNIGKKVLIIDANMNSGRQDKIFNTPNELGLSNYLSKLDSNGIEINEFLSKFINETEIKNLYVGGDGAGITRGLAQAGANGVKIARAIIEKETK